jgi:hypothetical protein
MSSFRSWSRPGLLHAAASVGRNEDQDSRWARLSVIQSGWNRSGTQFPMRGLKSG